MAGILGYVGLRRLVAIAVPLALSQVQRNLSAALAEDLVLSGAWQPTRRYRGHFEGDRLMLYGPGQIRQFCFRIRGHLTANSPPQQTRLKLEITLGTVSEIQLWATFGVLLALAISMPWPAGPIPAVVFFAFIYAMTQWHFAHYTQEVRELLHDCMVGHLRFSTSP
ncbi:hypothetical protein PN498_25125 [Oscillatoria sp. CS-180]|uniref:hypothetical protein n=1 Tax=Oscillatoria sp. CS-180 TaxID=3021720 RepID=UPI00232A9198|nr:hypothetical protein [Oscillatoria sp. CS-180]MDB9529299.1 hypothetical protein [Oscillatoria sp. CS-180]